MYSRFVKGFDSTGYKIASGLVCGFAVDGGDIFRYAEILREITPEYAENVLRSVMKLGTLRHVGYKPAVTGRRSIETTERIS